ncbi:hypothetical protein EN749_16055 [Mesorhizobium sp. M7A.F.Ca.ET.027.02.1.1]|uniref:hypothetical protein n=1 Tax=Mesorhizobium sp. M7A.F.Ca.ET.027.02.1.1 TaxID=2496655 RepID=UPI000FD5F907|nr:hypothetical protein [Mesorhizobium sp. M7A.F.Ca.ET.027.02.1.1]RVD15415.1 hypothetical protein EN749_16055 [Mesorhizobium sp. M7A.F.Ca.ET.027.02.1.1]
MNKEELERFAGSMSEEEMRARAEALEIGRLSIVEIAIAALITQVPHPDLIRSAIAIRLEELKAAKPDHPSLAWAPPQIHTGAKAAAERILALADMVRPMTPTSS